MTTTTSTSTRPAWAATAPDLHGRTVLVVGGSGGVGEGVVRELLDDGATVVATGRDPRRLTALADRTPSERLHVEPLEAMSPTLAADVHGLVERYGRFEGVVVAVASWGDQGRRPALALSDDQWQHLLDANLTSVFRLFRALLPALTPTGAILQLNGMSADIPFPGAAGVALSAAATKSLTLTLAAELGGRGPRVYQVVLGVVRTRARQEAGIDDEGWLDGTEVGAHVAGLVAGTSPLAGTPLHYLLDRTSGPQPTADQHRRA
jgi:NAD(P)-dependent dehydrogenase (short-subunit alcohol dehydrogenase family)